MRDLLENGHFASLLMMTLTSMTSGRWFGGEGAGDWARQSGTAAPVGDLGLVDLVALVVGRREARSGADGAVHVDHAAADATDQMMVVVADPILEAGRRAGGLDAADQAFGDQEAQRVVHRLERDGADLGPDDLGHAIGGDVGLAADRAEDRQTLGRDLNAARAKERRLIRSHGRYHRSNIGFAPKIVRTRLAVLERVSQPDGHSAKVELADVSHATGPF